MRRRQIFITAITAIITFVSLQAFVGHGYYRPYAWHRWHYWNRWGGPYEPYGPRWEPDSNYHRYRDGWNNEPRRANPSATPANPTETR